MKEIPESNFGFKTNIFYIEGLDKTFINIQMETDYVITEKTFSYFGLLEPLEIAKKEPRLVRKVLKTHSKRINKYLTKSYLKD